MIFTPVTFTLKDGRSAILRSPDSKADAADLVQYLYDTAADTPFVLRTPEEIRYTLSSLASAVVDTLGYALLDNSAIRPLSSYGRWFTSLSQITAASIESEADGFTFGQPMSIGDDLGGADTALLFIRCKATYYQPFRDGTALTRYWRNRPEWKEFREGLQELLPRVEK